MGGGGNLVSEQGDGIYTRRQHRLCYMGSFRVCLMKRISWDVRRFWIASKRRMVDDIKKRKSSNCHASGKKKELLEYTVVKGVWYAKNKE